MTLRNPIFGIAMSESQYAEEWKQNSRYFTENSLYEWMLTHLGDAQCVLEIGCGSGASTMKIAASGRSVLSIEVNKNAVAEAVKHLESANILVDVVTKESLKTWVPGGAKVTILCADIFDEEIDALLTDASFDAILCWMTGSYPEHIGKALGISFQSFQGNEMAAYREKLQRRCYRLGESLLKSGGVVHMVDRAAMTSWSDKDALRSDAAEMHKFFAGSEYAVGRADALFKRLDKPFNTSQIKYVAQAPVGAAQPKVTALLSVRTRRL